MAGPKKPPVPFLILLDINFSKKWFGSAARITAKPYIKKPTHYRSDIFKKQGGYYCKL
jgi:hypothetical protein